MAANKKEERQFEFITAYIDANCKMSVAIETSAVPERTVYNWLQEDDFNKELDKARKHLEHHLLAVAIDRASHKSDVLMIFILKSINPERYCDQARKEKLSRDFGFENAMTPEEIYFQTTSDEEPPFPPYEPPVNGSGPH